MGRSKYINNHIKEHYDRINLTVPKGVKDKIKERAIIMDMNVNEYINNLIVADLSGDAKKVYNTDYMELLEKWQIPKKYYEMVENATYSKDDGYYIYLKNGYINDATGTRILHATTTSQIRLLVNKSHEK